MLNRTAYLVTSCPLFFPSRKRRNYTFLSLSLSLFLSLSPILSMTFMISNLSDAKFNHASSLLRFTIKCITFVFFLLYFFLFSFFYLDCSEQLRSSIGGISYTWKYLVTCLVSLSILLLVLLLFVDFSPFSIFHFHHSNSKHHLQIFNLLRFLPRFFLCPLLITISMIPCHISSLFFHLFFKTLRCHFILFFFICVFRFFFLN